MFDSQFTFYSEVSLLNPIVHDYEENGTSSTGRFTFLLKCES